MKTRNSEQTPFLDGRHGGESFSPDGLIVPCSGFREGEGALWLAEPAVRRLPRSVQKSCTAAVVASSGVRFMPGWIERNRSPRQMYAPEAGTEKGLARLPDSRNACASWHEASQRYLVRFQVARKGSTVRGAESATCLLWAIKEAWTGQQRSDYQVARSAPTSVIGLFSF